jgi:hypothetical protein
LAISDVSGTPRHFTETIRRSPRHPDIAGLAACTAEAWIAGSREGRNDGRYVSGMLETWSRNAFLAAIAAYQRSKFSNAGRSGTSSR